jgi:hypothetical protein
LEQKTQPLNTPDKDANVQKLTEKCGAGSVGFWRFEVEKKLRREVVLCQIFKQT